MADKSYKVDQAITVVYQAMGAGTGLTSTMEVFDEAGIKDVAQSGSMTEIGTSGRYRKDFTPDAEGLWIVQIEDSAGGKSVKSYSVGNTNISEIGATVTTLNAKIDNLQSTVESVALPPIVA